MSIDKARETAINKKLRELKQETVLVVEVTLAGYTEKPETINVVESLIPKLIPDDNFTALKINLWEYLKAEYSNSRVVNCTILNIFKY